MTNLRDKLKEKHDGLSPLMANRAKLSTDDVIAADNLTLSQVHTVTSSDGNLFAVVVFAELDGFYFGGAVLTDIVVDIYKIMGADPAQVLDVTAENVKVSATMARSKNNRTYINWTIV